MFCSGEEELILDVQAQVQRNARAEENAKGGGAQLLRSTAQN